MGAGCEAGPASTLRVVWGMSYSKTFRWKWRKFRLPPFRPSLLKASRGVHAHFQRRPGLLPPPGPGRGPCSAPAPPWGPALCAIGASALEALRTAAPQGKRAGSALCHGSRRRLRAPRLPLPYRVRTSWSGAPLIMFTKTFCSPNILFFSCYS